MLGLTLGLSVFFLVSLYVYQENSYENDFKYKDRIYQLSTHYGGMDLAGSWKNTIHVLDEIPQIETFTSFSYPATVRLTVDNEEYEGLRQIEVDSNFFDVFDYDLLVGDSKTALNEPNSIIVSEKTALNLFNTTDVVGKLATTNKGVTGIIKGVSKATQYKTQLEFDFLVSRARHVLNSQDWRNTPSTFTYIVVAKETELDELSWKLDELNIKYVFSSASMGNPPEITIEEYRSNNQRSGVFAESIQDLRTVSESRLNLMPKMNSTQLDTLVIVGLASLLISIINFINLSTAKASVRMKEVGVKRILGSSRPLLISQFLIECFLIVFLSSLIALGLVELVVKLNPPFLGLNIEYSVLHSVEWTAWLVGFLFSLTLISGLYPALYLSSGSAISILKPGSSKSSFSVLNAASIRKGSIIVQYVGAVGLITAVIVMFLQVSHLRERDRGYTSDVAMVINTYSLKADKEALKNELLSYPEISAVTYVTQLPGKFVPSLSPPIKVKSSDNTEHQVQRFFVDEDFLEATGVRVIEGDGFKLDHAGQSVTGSGGYSPVLINEAAAKLFNEGENIGRVINTKYQVVGVVKDFSLDELRQSADPMIISKMTKAPQLSEIVVKTSSGKMEIETVQKAWAKFSNKNPYVTLLSDKYYEKLKEEGQGFYAVLVFSILAILISCLGLLGLAIFTVDQRFHEFGVRKVLGASVADIIALFSKDFAKLIAIAFVIAIPVSVYSMQNWLNNFADRIDLSVGVFIITAIVVFFIVAATILFQSLKAGRLNPVDTLRNE